MQKAKDCKASLTLVFIGVNIYISGGAGLYSLSQAWLLAYEGPLQEQQQINHLSFSSMAYQGHSRRG